jgi:hypothetical protein
MELNRADNNGRRNYEILEEESDTYARKKNLKYYLILGLGGLFVLVGCVFGEFLFMMKTIEQEVIMYQLDLFLIHNIYP